MTGYGDAYGQTLAGYGDPPAAVGAVVTPADAVVPDDGGVPVVLQGEWPAGAYLVQVGGVTAYSGVSGRGAVCFPVGDQLRFILPGGLPVGPATISVVGGGGTVELPDALTVVRRHRRELTYLYNRLASPLGPHRARGPVTPVDDEVHL